MKKVATTGFCVRYNTRKYNRYQQILLTLKVRSLTITRSNEFNTTLNNVT
jgi:hypothetical protein